MENIQDNPTMKCRANYLKMVALPLAVVTALPVWAVDSREVYIERQVNIAITPEHLGHVLASPNRNFALPYVNDAYSWRIYAQPRSKASWVDKSYLQDPRNIEIRGIYFDFDIDTPIDAPAVMELMASIKDLGASFLVVGHADEVGSDAYNMNLSVRRAVNVRDLLVEVGVDRSSIKSIGKGNHVLASLRNQALNRRVEILVRGNRKVRAEVEAALASQAAEARRLKMERDALERARHARSQPVGRVSPSSTTLVPSSAAGRTGSVAPNKPRVVAPQKSPMTATQKALLPPVRESQFGSGNPFNKAKDQ